MKQLTPAIEQQFSDWQRSLAVRGKDTPAIVQERQEELHQRVGAGPAAFAAYLRAALDLTPDEVIDAPRLPRPVTATEYHDPPLELERTLHQSWSNTVCARDAARPLFWMLAHIHWLEAGSLGDRIDAALLRGGSRDKTPDQRTRNLLRRIGGLPHVRGKVSVLSDCPMSRAWWRGSIAADIVSASGDDFDLDASHVHRVLHSNNDAWARLAGNSVHRVTVINQARVRAALIAQFAAATRDGEPVVARMMERAAQLLARHGHALFFDTLSWDDLSAIAHNAVEEARVELG